MILTEIGFRAGEITQLSQLMKGLYELSIIDYTAHLVGVRIARILYNDLCDLEVDSR